MTASVARADAVVIGAGFAGLYALHTLRERGLDVVGIEAADAVGGTWLFNRYPGARCDLESIEYSYSFSKEIEQEWEWTELMPAQPEIEAYLNFVADRLDLRPLIRFETMVTGLTYDEISATWSVQTEAGDRYEASYVVAATGLLSVPIDPDIPGMADFAGTSVFSSRYPREGVDFDGKRVGIIGTGSTGVQATPRIAEHAEHLYVFQRSAAYTFPSTSRPYEPGELDQLKAQYPAIRAAQREAMAGAARTSAFSVMAEAGTRPPLRTATREEQLAALDEYGRVGALFWCDVAYDMEAAEMARQLYGEAIARTVKDPATAAALIPSYPFGCKRPIIDEGYYDAFNRDNVSLVDLTATPIERITPTGIQTSAGHIDLDLMFYATGFDGLTGALTRMDVRGRGGASLREQWTNDGPGAYLGLQVAGFPNLFIVGGPGGPGALANVAAALEIQIDWIADCIDHVRSTGRRAVEPDPETQAEWVGLMSSLVEGTVVLHPSCNSWWNGANVAGKKRIFMSFAAGLPEYRARCEAAATSGYQGFVFA
jgi:cation diffusion facilitator CzcD-associated flavoprotein CzcO